MALDLRFPQQQISKLSPTIYKKALKTCNRFLLVDMELTTALVTVDHNLLLKYITTQ